MVIGVARRVTAVVAGVLLTACTASVGSSPPPPAPDPALITSGAVSAPAATGPSPPTSATGPQIRLQVSEDIQGAIAVGPIKDDLSLTAG